ncbi:hypothetical protein V6N11_051741 [Hibiscus sabdariffa]|uniref:Uncharacterized protein n=1 Tax=Hibiscus sabdariffa TaxID=183260 RepID=A0ABR2U7Z4_9ROSI
MLSAGKYALGGGECAKSLILRMSRISLVPNYKRRECVRDCAQVDLAVPMQRSGQISVEALAPRASLWELVLNELNDDFVEVPGVCHEGQPPFLTSVNPLCKICLLVVMPWQGL